MTAAVEARAAQSLERARAKLEVDLVAARGELRRLTENFDRAYEREQIVWDKHDRGRASDDEWNAAWSDRERAENALRRGSGRVHQLEARLAELSTDREFERKVRAITARDEQKAAA